MELSRRARAAALGGLALLGLAAAAWALLGRGDAAPVNSVLLDQARVVVEVLNGSGRRGLARYATRELRKAGFDVISFGTGPDSTPATQVLARRGDSAAAVRVARALGVGRTSLQTDTLLRVDVTVLLGADYHPPPVLRP